MSQIRDQEYPLRVESIGKKFAALTALEGVSFQLERGKILGILGPNGAGKTTLVRILTTVLSPGEGDAYVAGYDIRRDPFEVRRRIGLTGQYAAIDEMLTGFENLEMIGRLSRLSRIYARKRAVQLLEEFSLTNASHLLVRTYSGGMRRRLDIAASMIGNPEVLFLDEPTSGLDPASRRDLWRLVKQLSMNGMTILLTTQHLEEADALADHIAVIDQGHLIAFDTPQALKRRIGHLVLEIRLEDSDRLGDLARILGSYTEDLPEIHEETHTCTVRIKDGSASFVPALESVRAGGITIDEAALRHPNLDEVFFFLTGGREESSLYFHENS